MVHVSTVVFWIFQVHSRVNNILVGMPVLSAPIIDVKKNTHNDVVIQVTIAEISTEYYKTFELIVFSTDENAVVRFMKRKFTIEVPTSTLLFVWQFCGEKIPVVMLKFVSKLFAVWFKFIHNLC